MAATAAVGAASGATAAAGASSASAGSQTDPDEAAVQLEIESSVIDVFSDAYCNKHLVYGILELVLVRLMPELGEKGIVELWDERLS